MSGNLHFTAVCEDNEHSAGPVAFINDLSISKINLNPPQVEPAAEESGEPEIEVFYADEREPSHQVSTEDQIEEDSLEARYEALRREKAESDRRAAEEAQRARDLQAAFEAARQKHALADDWRSEDAAVKDAERRFVEAGYDDEVKVKIMGELNLRTQRREELARAWLSIPDAQIPQPARHEPKGDPIEQWISTAGTHLHDADKEFIRSRRQFIEADPENARLLQSAAVLAEHQGFQPGSPEYHARINETLRLDEPTEPVQPVRQSRSRGSNISKRPVAAPASRSTGRSSPQSVFLSEFDMKTAKEIGMSFRDYAEIKANANKGQYDRSVTGGRLHASYDVNSVNMKDYY
jgi:hypothetical protein